VGKEYKMEFTPITSQEQLDAVIADRLQRKDEAVAKQIKELTEAAGRAKDLEKANGELTKALEEAGKKVANHDKEVGELNATIKKYESASVKTRIAHETGLPYELASRLTGEDEDSIRKDAEALSKLVSKRPAPPLADPEGSKDDKDAGLKKMLHDLKGKGE